MKIIYYVSKFDIDLEDKLVNLLDSEISEEVYKKCLKSMREIEDAVWNLMVTHEDFSKTMYYDGLASEYEAESVNDLHSAEVYNCDLLYMTAIAMVLRLPIPKSSGDIHIFGM